jgi:hypothetical protein
VYVKGCDEAQTGQIAQNLLPFIDYKHIVIDVLHLHLRVSDRLYHCFIDGILKARFSEELTKQEAAEAKQKKSKAKAKNSTDVDKLQEDWVNEHIAPAFQIAGGQSNLRFSLKKGVWAASRMADGTCRRINKNLQLAPLLPDDPDRAAAYQKALKGFVLLYDAINSPVVLPDPDEHRKHAKRWLHALLHPETKLVDGKETVTRPAVFGHTFLTPYVHVCVRPSHSRPAEAAWRDLQLQRPGAREVELCPWANLAACLCASPADRERGHHHVYLPVSVQPAVLE